MENWRSRCDWCGWPLYTSVEEGCIEDNCSRRPVPQLTPNGGMKRTIRALEYELSEFVSYLRQRDDHETIVPQGHFIKADKLLADRRML